MTSKLIYDGQCDFCKRCVKKLQQAVGHMVTVKAYQDGITGIKGLTKSACEKAVQLVTKGKIYSGAHGIFKSIETTWYGKGLLFAYEKIKPFKFISDAVYNWTANNRPLLSKVSSICYGESTEPSSYKVSSWLFIKGLFGIYFLALVSLFSQFLGLFGSQGIMSIANIMAYVERTPEFTFFKMPSLLWMLPTSDFALQFLLGLGILISIIGFFGYAQKACLIALWVLYLSFQSASPVFLSFQWDILLLEVGFLAIFLIRFKRKNTIDDTPNTLAHWLLRWVLFRVMFASGVVKLISGDPNWQNGTALTYHYLTQPLPHLGGWFASQMPDLLHVISSYVMFAIELVVSFLILAPRHLRRWSLFPLIGLQLIILMTGNYGFFNILMIVLTILVVEDHYIPINNPETKKESNDTCCTSYSPLCCYGKKIILIAGIILFLTGLNMEVNRLFKTKLPFYSLTQPIETTLRPFKILNGYGLFAIMTTKRYEIEIQGSQDGKTWKSYGFKYKPGNLNKAPQWVQPHQPRLDWQMWFASLGSIQNNRWLLNTMQRLLEGSESVLGLFESNPFPNKPPSFIKGEVYNYEYTSQTEFQETGNRWKRTYVAPYTPALNLK